MLFHKEKKLALFLPPKTGTTTAIRFLPTVGWNILKPYHEKPDYFQSKYPNLATYKKFSFLRDPLDRFGSAVRHTRNVYDFAYQNFYDRIGLPLSKIFAEMGVTRPVSMLSYDEFVDYLPIIESKFPVFSLQANWFTDPNTEALDFSNYEAELRRISGATDPVQYPIAVQNSSNKPENDPEITAKVIDFVRERYAADYLLAKELLGKDY